MPTRTENRIYLALYTLAVLLTLLLCVANMQYLHGQIDQGKADAQHESRADAFLTDYTLDIGRGRVEKAKQILEKEGY